MKKFLGFIAALIVITSCSSDNFNNNNNFLPDYNFDAFIDLTLPSYNGLLYTGNPVYIGTAGYGINGIIVMKTGGGYVAWEASCPNQPISQCSMLSINGITATCPCDDVEYSIFTGQPSTGMRYGLKPYRIQIISDNAIKVYN